MVVVEEEGGDDDEEEQVVMCVCVCACRGGRFTDFDTAIASKGRLKGRVPLSTQTATETSGWVAGVPFRRVYYMLFFTFFCSTRNSFGACS